jgi:predicted Rossmann-fold nucleotide-binding protein
LTALNTQPIAVFGGKHPAPGDPEYAEAVKLGSLLLSSGYGVISGGYSGVLEAVPRGAAEAGGTAVGVTKGIFGNLKPDPFLTSEIRTRNFLNGWRPSARVQTVLSRPGAEWGH